MNPPEMSIALKAKSAELKALREAAGLTIQQMAEKSGILVSTIYRMEGGEFSWTMTTEIVYRDTIKKESQRDRIG